MTFTHVCVGIVITILVLLVTAMFGWITEDGNHGVSVGAWIASSMGFGVCLTILLYQNGLIQ